MNNLEQVRIDFDRIASKTGSSGWNHNNHYHDYLLKHVPKPCHHALDIGCGTGEFSRQLAKKADHVLGLDLSPEMLQRAREESPDDTPITYLEADVMTYPLEEAHFDCIASIATMHHLPYADICQRVKQLLRPGGVFLVLDLYESQSFADYTTNIAAIPVHRLLNRLNNGQVTQSEEEKAAWDAHGAHDTYMTLADIQETTGKILPGAIVRRHLLWRYSLVWHKPADSLS